MLPSVRVVLGRTNPRTYEREKSKSNMTAFLLVCYTVRFLKHYQSQTQMTRALEQFLKLGNKK